MGWLLSYETAGGKATQDEIAFLDNFSFQRIE